MSKLITLQLIDSLDVGGAEVLAVNIANELAIKKEIKHSHLCVSRNEGMLKNNIDEKVKYFFLNRKKTIDLKSFKDLRKYIKINDINIIHAHSNSYFIAIMSTLFLSKIKIIWHNHTGNNVHLKGLKLRALKVFSKKFSGIINVNKPLLDWSKKKLHTKQQHYFPNFPNFGNTKKSTLLKGHLGKRIVCVAGLRKEKDHLNLLNAFLKTLKKHPDWTLHLIGKDYQDKYSEEIHNFVALHKLQNSLFFYGLSNDIEHILKQSNIAVLSSVSEGLPISLLEYGLAKLPVVVTDVGECRKVLQNGENGIIVPPNNSDELANAIEKLIENKNQTPLFAKKLNTEIQTNYSKSKFIERLLTLYRYE